jgi:acetyl esterase/lipase
MTKTSHAITSRRILCAVVGALCVMSGLSGISNTAGATTAPKMPVATGGGVWVVGSGGGVYPRGGAVSYGSMAGQHLNAPMIAMAPTIDAQGYWLLGRDGGIFSYGDAHFYGSTGNIKLNSPVVSMAAAPDGEGYWFVASDGGIFAYGAGAGFYGSMGGTKLSKPIVGMAPTPSGKGYWLVASDGGIFAFGDAGYYGSMGGKTLSKPIVGISTSVDGHGYRMVAADGGIFSFGDAPFYGSAAGKGAVGISSTADGAGYWIVNSSGQVFSYGDAGVVSAATVGTSGAAGVAGVVVPGATHIVYGSLPSEGAYVYPSAVANSPVVVLVHGGGYTGGLPSDPLVAAMARYLQLHNVTVFSIDYTHAGPTQTAFPSQPVEVAGAVSLVHSTLAVQYNGNPNRISMVGGSAGGTLVALAEPLLVTAGVPLVSVSDLSGPSDFVSFVAWIKGSMPTGNSIMNALALSVSEALGCPGNVVSACTSTQELPASFVDTPVGAGVKWLVAGSQSDPLVPVVQTNEAVAHVAASGSSEVSILPAGGDHAFELHWAVSGAILKLVSS